MNIALESTPKNPSNRIEVVEAQVRSVKFGIVQIVVHDNRVMQIEKTEKVRFGSPLISDSRPSPSHR